MKTIPLAAAVLVASAGIAFAADLPVRSAPPPAPYSAAPAFTWTGFYVGLNAGGAWNARAGRNFCIDPAGVLDGPNCQKLPAGENGSPRVDGVFGGVQLGYNAQFGRIVAGIEGDLQIGSVKGSKTINGPFGFYGGPGVAMPAGVASTHLSMNTFGTLRARLGYTVTDNTLLYATGGLIVANIKTRSLFSTPNTSAVYESGSKTNTKAGWTAGVGIEHYFTHHLSGKVEALYYDLGSVVSYGYAPVNGQGYSHNQRFETRGALVRVGLNYKFGG